MSNNKGSGQVTSRTPETDSTLTKESMERKRGVRKGILLIVCAFLIGAALVTVFSCLMTERGYYTKDGELWYYEHYTWFTYSADSDDWIRTDSPGFFRNLTAAKSVPAGIPDVFGSSAYRYASNGWADAEKKQKKETEGTIVDFIADAFGKSPEEQ